MKHQQHRTSANRTLCVLLSGGGFWGEIKGLLPALTKGRPWSALVPEQDQGLLEEITPPTVHILPSMVQSRAQGISRSPREWIKAIVHYRRVLKSERPVAAVGLGANDCLPLAIACRLTRTPFVFIETVTRVADISLTGKLIYHCRLASRYYVQWERLSSRYPRSLYKGIVHDLRDRRDDAF